MLGEVEPNFRTISDFKKDNIDRLKEIFYEFNCRISEIVECDFILIDESKFYANNSKDNNFTKNKLDDQIKWLNAHTDEYLRIMEDINEQETLEETPEIIFCPSLLVFLYKKGLHFAIPLILYLSFQDFFKKWCIKYHIPSSNH